MRHLRATRLLPRLVLATCSAAAFVSLNVAPCQAQDEPTAVATDAPAAEPQPWQPQLAELSEQLALLRQELDELKSRPTPDTELEIKRLDEKIDLLRSLLSKPDAPSRADLDSLRDFLSLQDSLVERHAAGEIKRIDEKVDYFRDTLIDRMNNYVWSFGIIGTGFVVLVTFFGRNTITAWIKQQIADTTEEKISKYVETELKEQGENAINQLLEEFKPRAQKILDDYSTLQEKIERVVARHETRLFDSPETPEEKAEVKELTRELAEIKEPSLYTAREWYVKGIAAVQAEDWEQAHSDFTSALEKNPSHAGAYNARAMTLVALERYDEALADSTKAVEIEPDVSHAYNTRGITLSLLERPEEGLADFTKAIEIEPNTAAFYVCHGNALSKLNRHEEALTEFAKAIEMGPNDAVTYNNRGITLCKLERYDEALADFTKVIEIEPDYVNAFLRIAELQIVTCKPDSALEYLTSATTHIRESHHRAICAFFTCISTVLLGNDTNTADAEYAAAMEEDFKKTWAADGIESWLKKAELDENVRTYIREKTEQFKAH